MDRTTPPPGASWPPRPPDWLGGFTATPEHPDGSGDLDAPHDTEYARWREEHARQLDAEYLEYRRHRFSRDFDAWREERRARPSGSAVPSSSQRVEAGSLPARPARHGAPAQDESAADAASPTQDARVRSQLFYERS